MATLRPGATLAWWPGATLALHPELGTAWATAATPEDLLAGRWPAGLEAYASDTPGDADASPLAALDARYNGWIPGGTPAALTAHALAMHSRCRMFTPPRGAWASLPGSAARRAQRLLALQLPRAILLDDPDAVSVLLAAAGMHVVVCEPDPIRRAWLLDETERAGVSERCAVVSTLVPTSEPFDLLVGHLGPPRANAATLGDAANHLREGGVLAASFSAPWDLTLFDAIAARGYTPLDQLREVDHPVLLGRYVLDSARDFALWRRAANLDGAPLSSSGAGDLPVPAAPSAAENVAAAPYVTTDVADLPGERLEEGALERFVDVLARLRGPGRHSLTQSKGREIVCWFDADGHGLSAQLHRAERHLLMTFTPYHPLLDHGAHCAVFLALGDQNTRTAPVLAIRFAGETVVG